MDGGCEACEGARLGVRALEIRDIIIIGGGPAGLSAAITARQRDMTVAVITNDRAQSGLYKAREIGNYPGLPAISGKELSDRLTQHAQDAGTEFIAGQVNVIVPAGESVNVGVGTDIYAARSVILATGIAQASLFPGEEELLGRGVSYCATCDGMFFRGKKVCVICLKPDAEEEADHLASIGCDVIRMTTQNIAIKGETHVTSIVADGEEISCDGIFILRKTIAPNLMLPGLETENGHIRAGKSGETNIRGVFAAGDCIGTPYQISKAAGEGQVAALSAAEYISAGKR